MFYNGQYMKQSFNKAVSFFWQGWAIFKQEPWKIIGVMAVLLAASFLSSFLFGGKDAGMLGIVDSIINAFIGLGFILMALAIHDSPHSFTLMNAWEPRRFIPYVITSILTALCVLVGLILLVVPGIIAVTGLALSPYLVVDRKMNPIDAMKKSWELTKGSRLTIFFLILIAILVNIAGALLLFIGLIVSIPVTMLAFVSMYRSFMPREESSPAPVSA